LLNRVPLKVGDQNVTTLYLVRHGRPASGYGDSLDPGLDETGLAQARRTARELASLPHPLPVYSSPLRRCRETGLPLAELWGVQPIIFPEVGEVPSPPLSLEQRQEWLRAAMKSDWAFMQSSAPADAPDYGLWRTTLLDALRAMSGDVVIFSHFIAINAVIGAALGNEQVINFRPDHASITTVEVASGNFLITALGQETAGTGSVMLGRSTG
jgi:broad specificity phosphatase PhoE